PHFFFTCYSPPLDLHSFPTRRSSDLTPFETCSGISPMKVVLCWHMHQPEYRDLDTGEFAFPWTYLHAIKDYVEMIAHLEANPGACAVVNFAPVLLDQIDVYCHRIDAYFNKAAPLADPILSALVQADFEQQGAERLVLLKKMLRV